MKKNVGNTDRIIRLIVAVVVAILFFNNIITGTLGIALMVLAVIFLLTGLVSFCPIYAIFGIRTYPVESKK